MKKLTIILSLFAAISCGSKITEMDILCDESNAEPIANSFVCELGEEVQYQPMPQEIAFVDDECFVATSANNPTVYMYNLDGMQLKVVGAIGRAKGEYVFPSSAAAHNGNIYLSCAQTKKIIAYDMNGKYISEMTDFPTRCGDIAITDDYIYRINASNHYVEVTSTSNEDQVTYIGEYSDVDMVLSQWSWTNVMCEYEDGIIYVDPVTLSVYRVVGTTQELLFNLSASKYRVDANVDYDNLMSYSQSEGYKKMDDYADKTSTVSHVGVWGNTLYIVVSHGGANDTALITVNIPKRKATYRPIKGYDYKIEKKVINNYQLHNGELYFLGCDIENDIQFIGKLDL